VNRRIGSVPYLNARPLIQWFHDTEEGRGSGFVVEEAPPSRLAESIAEGTIDCGLVSSIEAFRAGYGFAPGIGISADGPVESVRLFCQCPIGDVRRVALDTSSRTSVALLRILCEHHFRIRPEFVPMPPDRANMLAACDAALLIGDKGFEPGEGLYIVDLGTAWRDLTQLPFVYALWIGPRARMDSKLQRALESAMEWGTARIPEIAASTAVDHGTDPARALHYLRDVMRFDWNERHEAGFRAFGRYCVEMGLVDGTFQAEHSFNNV